MSSTRRRRSQGSGSIHLQPFPRGPKTGGSSRLVPRRRSKIPLHQPTRPSSLFFVFAILSAPSLIPAFHNVFFLLAGKGGFRISTSGIGVSAEPCSSSELQEMTVSNDEAFNISDIFACEGGNFNVSWVGVVNVSETINIGQGTTVRIFGEREGTTSSRPTISSGSNGSDDSSGDITDIELELETLSSDLNLPQGLSSAVVGSIGIDDDSNSIVSFGSIFFVDGGVLHLESLAVRRGNSTGNGGAIYAEQSSISVSSCEFEDNFAEQDGGGIYANLSTLTIWDSVFRANIAGSQSLAGDEDADGEGGGIACDNTDLYLDGCLFDDNYANNKGGGVIIEEGQVSIVNSLFFNNLAGSDNVEFEEPFGEGAALSFTDCNRSFDGQSSCSVNDTTFVYNTVAKKGGAVSVSSGSSYIEFHRCVVDNTTTGWPFEDDPQGEGGAFSLGSGTTMVIEDCVVKNNYCGRKGGVFTVSSGDDWENPGGTIIMRNSTFTGNIAKFNSAGVVNLGEFATARFEGQGNNFTGNVCGLYGGVLAATTNTNVTVEGGLFQGNEADEGGGVFWVKGNFSIKGGNFSHNYVSENSGGVVFASDYSSVTLSGGHFEGNDALNGGVGFVELDALMLVEGGVYTGNIAQNGGGVFWGEDGGDLHIIGGVFKGNVADFGGFLYAEANGITSCEGASVEENVAVNGGAIYAVDGAVVDCACHLIGNEALSGPAIYARVGSNVTIRGVNVSDNVVSQGSAMFIVSSTLYTYRVNVVDSTGSFDLSAVQSDPDSTYIAEETAFVGFQGETVVYSEGTLYLDDCDFSESSASMLVYSDANATTVVRNAVLGDSNFEAAIEKASAASEIPGNASLINVELTCSDPVSSCSAGSPCLEGDLGVYCQCYERKSSSEKVCLNGDPEGLSKANITAPSTTYYPDLLEGDLILALDAVDGCGTCLSPTTTSTTATSLLTSDGVVWNTTATSQKPISWTVFPCVGLLRPGNSITLRVVGLPSETFDGTATATFAVGALGAPNQEEASTSNSLSYVEDGSESQVNVLAFDMEVTFYHCEAGSFWNLSDDESSSGCELCTDINGDDEGLDCSNPGVSTLNLPLNSGYWRASLYTTVIRECFNEDACVGGSVTNVDDYCATGYEGPLCGVCATGYGRGSANTCHKCTEEFKGVMYFAFVVVTLLTIVVIVLLGAYLVGGRVAVSQVVSTAIVSGRKLRCRIFMGSKFAGQNDSGSLSRMDSSCKEVTSGRGSARVRGAVSGNAAASAFCPSAATTVHTADDGNYITRQKTDTARGDGFHITGLESDCKPIEDSESSSDLRIFQASDSFRIVPAKGLAHESSRTPALAEEKYTSEDGRVCAGVDLSRTSVPVPAPNPVGELASGGNGRQEEKEESSDDGNEEKTATVVIGKFLARLPLSKLKIIIVVWQISSAFIEITEVSFPTVYENFLSTIGLFSFDLSWILSATCMTDELDFYDGLLTVTIGPFFLLGLLGITFHLGLRDLRSVHRGKTPENINNLGMNGNVAINMNSSGAAALSTTIGDMKTPQDDPTSVRATSRKYSSRGVGGDVDHPLRISHATTSDKISKGEKGRLGMTRRWSIRRVLKEGPGDDPDSEQNHVWGLFARHTTVTLIILYLVYSQVSTTVFQTFVCEDLDEIGKSYLRADLSVECNTPKHEAYKIYAAIMICVYPLGIPAAFCYFLVRQKSHINPSVEESVESVRGDDHVLEKKVERRMEDPTVAPTSFLWAAYYPDRYYFEVCECIRRLFLTGVLVFLAPDTAEQVAYSCLFAFISLFAFELLVPHMDPLDRVLYRTGCLVIFFTNFLALLIKAEVADPDAGGSTAFSIGLIIANISLVIMSVWWNTWATIKAMFSRSHVQGMTIGIDIIGEDKIDSLAAAMKAKETKGHHDTGDVVKTETEDFEAAPEWDRDSSVGGELSNMNSNRTYNQERRQHIVNAYIADTILNPPTLSASQASGSSDDCVDLP